MTMFAAIFLVPSQRGARSFPYSLFSFGVRPKKKDKTKSSAHEGDSGSLSEDQTGRNGKRSGLFPNASGKIIQACLHMPPDRRKRSRVNEKSPLLQLEVRRKKRRTPTSFRRLGAKCPIGVGTGNIRRLGAKCPIGVGTGNIGQGRRRRGAAAAPA
ncbi:hypothetical protein Bbelb_215480 [Branchiostoma belcheri]|nr:hypothetical protein Bbelb_215480 [Branchiostoma belcheri]